MPEGHLKLVGDHDNPIGEPWSLKASDVAEYIGKSREQVYRIPPEKLPYLHHNRTRRYRASDVLTFVEDHLEEGVA